MLSLLLAGPLACGAGDGAIAAVSVRDSAGVRIVESSAPAWEEGDAWRVAEAPETSIGAVEGDEAYLFGEVVDAARLSDGRIAVADAGSAEIRFFDAHGRHLATTGGSGEGPGEFRQLQTIGVLTGDTLFAFDSALRRVSVFGSTGAFSRSVQLPTSVGRVREARLLGDGHLMVEAVRSADRSIVAGATWRDTVLYVQFDSADVANPREVATVPGAPWIAFSVDGGSGFAGMPLTTAPAWTVVGDMLYITPGTVFEIRRRPLTGTGAGILRRTIEPEPVTAEHVARFKGAALEGVPEGMVAAMRRILDSWQFPEVLPAYQTVLHDPAGNLWLEHYRVPGDERSSWDVFGPDGAYLGEVHMPAGLRVLDIGHDYVLGRAQDELGVEYVRVHRLFRGAQPRG